MHVDDHFYTPGTPVFFIGSSDYTVADYNGEGEQKNELASRAGLVS
jgi:hypothetical protein